MAGVPAGRLSIEIVAEIARLQQDLDKAKRAVNAASKDIAKSAQHANDNLSGMAGGIAKAGSSSKLASHHMANLSFQIQDIIIGLQGGQKPMTVFLQQGSQIGQIMAQSGMGIVAMTKAVLGMSVAFIAANPLLLAAAAAAGVVAATLALVTEEINKTSAVTVTWQDVMLGAFDVVSDAVSSQVTSAFEAMGLDIGEVWEAVKRYTKAAINFIIGMNLAVPKLIADTYDKIPAAFGDAFYSAANLAIEALNKLAQMSAVPLNLIIDGFNSAFGTTIPKIVIGGIDKIANPYAGAMSALGSAGAKSLVGTFTTDYVGNIASALSDAAQNRARLRQAAEKGGKEAGKAGGKVGGKAMADEFAKEFEKGWQDFIKGLNDQLANIPKQAAEILKASDAELAKILKDISEGLSPAAQAAVDAAEAQARWNDELRATISSLSQIGTIGQKLGDIGGILSGLSSGDFSGARGSAGFLLGQLANIQWVDYDENGRIVKKMGEEFTKALDGVFGGNGKFTEVMNNLLAGAGTGAAVGSILGGGQGAQLGSLAGGALGQALGAAAGKAIGGALGSAMGPLGSIAGSLVGNLLGSALSSTKRGGQTISNGALSSTWGNSSSRIDASTQMASNAIQALTQLADALGTTLGSFSSSVSVRDGNLRFDPTGSGISKTSKGAIDFGQDEAGLLKALIADAISDGAFEGLSEGFKNYLTSGDVEKRLQDVLSLRGVMNEAAQLRDPQAFALGELDKQFAELRKIAEATGEGLADVEYVYGERRKAILEQFGTDTVQIEKDRQALLIQIAELEGRTTDALAMARALEMAEVDASLKPLYERIYALQDATAAEQAATAALEQNRALAKQNAQEMFSLQERLFGAQGNDAMVTRLQRENELRQATSALVREQLLAIYAAEDLATATAKVAAEAEAAAAKAESIAQERFGLETRLLQLQGNTATLRQRELDALDPANRALLEMIFNLEDVQTAAANAAQAAEELAAQQKEIADEISGLNRQWLELTGQTQTLRDMDLELLKSDEARAIQQAIWNYQDALAAQQAAQEAATAAMEAYSQRLDDARNTLVSAYERESGALQSTIDKFKDFSATIKEFRDGLISGRNPAFGLAQAQATFTSTSRMAGLGNEASLSAFTGDAQAYLDAAKASGTYEQYQRAMASVLAGSNGAIRSADSMVSMSQRQLDQMTGIAETLDLIRDDNVSFNDALTDYNKLLTEEAIPQFTETVSVSMDRMARAVDDGTESAQKTGEKAQVTLETMTIAINRMERLLSRMERDGSFAVTLDGEKVQIDGIVATQGAVTVTNTPLPVDQV